MAATYTTTMMMRSIIPANCRVAITSARAYALTLASFGVMAWVMLRGLA